MWNCVNLRPIFFFFFLNEYGNGIPLEHRELLLFFFNQQGMPLTCVIITKIIGRIQILIMEKLVCVVMLGSSVWLQRSILLKQTDICR